MVSSGLTPPVFEVFVPWKVSGHALYMRVRVSFFRWPVPTVRYLLCSSFLFSQLEVLNHDHKLSFVVLKKNKKIKIIK